MIKFFRKIRQNLLMENKTGKYFKYAIGEIMLVVIGILIALQLNTWNENRQNHKKLTSYLHGVISDFNTDLVTAKNLTRLFTEDNKNIKLFINHPDYNELTRDSLENGMSTYDKSELSFNDTNFNKIVNSGIIEFGTYEDVINGITQYYRNLVPQFKNLVKTHNQEVDREDHYWQIQQNSYEFNRTEGLNSTQTDSQAKKAQVKLLKTPTARNILKSEYKRNEDYIFYLKTM